MAGWGGGVTQGQPMFKPIGFSRYYVLKKLHETTICFLTITTAFSTKNFFYKKYYSLLEKSKFCNCSIRETLGVNFVDFPWTHNFFFAYNESKIIIGNSKTR